MVHTNEDIRTGFDWEAFKSAGEAYGSKNYTEGRKQTKVYAMSAKEHLRHLWGYMRAKCETHGFGRSELMPIHYPDNIGSYLGKYLNKEDEQKHKKQYKLKGRSIAYGRLLPKVASANFSWVKNPQGKKPWRILAKEWAEYRGMYTEEQVRGKYGKNWSHHCYPEIVFDYVRMAREQAGLPPIGERKDPYWYVPSQEVWDTYLLPDEKEHTTKLKMRAREKNAFEHWKNRKKFTWLWD